MRRSFAQLRGDNSDKSLPQLRIVEEIAITLNDVDKKQPSFRDLKGLVWGAQRRWKKI